jgi:hypothetical protein
VTDTVFIPDRREELCGSQAGGRVDKRKLLQAIIDDAQVPFSLLDRANPAGTSDGIVTEDELLYALTAANPFGRPASELGPMATSAARRLTTVRGALNDFVNLGAPAASGYRVTRTGTRPVTTRDIFAPTSNIVIECVALASDITEVPPAGDASSDKGPNVLSVLSAVNQRLRIRGQVDELGIPRGELQSSGAEYAEISFKRDEMSHTDTFLINAVIGYELYGESDRSTWRFIPYVHYQRNEVKPDSDSEVHTVVPGALISQHFFWDRSFFNVGLSPEATFDIAQESRVVRTKFFAEPSFRIGREGSDVPVLGGYMDEIGPIALRPAAALIGELAYVTDKGTNAALEDQRSYFGLGFETSLRLRTPFVPVLANFEAGVTYRYLQLFGTNIANAHRLSASLNYQLTQFVAMAFEYIDGRNEETFQQERFWSVSLGFRY